MDNRVLFAEQIAALAATVSAAVGLASAPLAGVAVPLGVLGAIGYSIWQRCPKRNCERAVQEVLDSISRSPDVTDEIIARASAVLNEKSRQIRFPPKLSVRAAQQGGAEGFDRELAKQLTVEVGLDDSDRDLRNLLAEALAGAIAACRKDPEISKKLTQDLLLEAAKENGVMLELLQKVDKRTEETHIIVSDTHGIVKQVGEDVGAMPEKILSDSRSLAGAMHDQTFRRSRMASIYDKLVFLRDEFIANQKAINLINAAEFGARNQHIIDEAFQIFSDNAGLFLPQQNNRINDLHEEIGVLLKGRSPGAPETNKEFVTGILKKREELFAEIFVSAKAIVYT